VFVCSYGLLAWHIWKCLLQNNVQNKKFCVLLHKSHSETLRMLEEVHGKVAMKKSQVYGWHKHGHASINDDSHCGQCSWSHSLQIYSTRVNCKQRNVHRNPLSPRGCSEKQTSRKMRTKQLVSSAQQHSGHLVKCSLSITT
jgi:hypothetical protein